MSEFGIEHVWNQDDFVTRSVASVLMIMSIMSWCVIVIKFIQSAGLKRIAQRSKNDFWNEKNLPAAINLLGNAKFNPFRELAIAGHAALSQQYNVEASISQQLDTSDL